MKATENESNAAKTISQTPSDMVRQAYFATDLSLTWCHFAGPTTKRRDRCQCLVENTWNPRVRSNFNFYTLQWRVGWHSVYSFLTSSKHIHTPWGHALQVALTTTASSNKNKPSFHTQEALLTAMELIRFEVLTNKPYTKSYSRIAGDGKLFLSLCIHIIRNIMSAR